MKVIIIEDELPAYKRLSKLLQEVTRDKIEILTHLDSIEASLIWLQNNPTPHVVFLDIHLADGSAFDLLKKVKPDCPIIFTTAYDQYALEAFKTDGLDYLLKPIKKEDLLLALQKRNRFTKLFSQKETTEETPKVNTQTLKKRFIVRFGEHIKTLDVEEIAYCFSSHKATCACTFAGQVYPIDYNLDALEQMLNPMDYFRVNRQFITHIRAIKEMKTYSKGRVFLALQPAIDESLIVSSEKSAKFKKWLGGEL
ncbi:response regulator transcription factor [Taibaiella lutea]|uniref:Response regulator transcription factor n=1 Tax=Taibaiella lutea TaxID=2608001 RepID=A0A5M6CJG5_9BACT|nr:response regulator transcription factor [Taibaiella lutea]